MHLISAQAPTPTSPQKSETKDSGTADKSASPPQNLIGFLAGLSVNMRLLTKIAQGMISLYALCKRYNEDFNSTPNLVSSTPSAPSAWTRSAHSHAQTMAPVEVQAMALLLHLAVMVTGEAHLVQLA